MRQVLGHFRQQPRENLEYRVNYTPWLAEGETLNSAVMDTAPLTDPALVVSNIYIDSATADTEVVFFVGQGKSGQTYQLSLLVTTSLGQAVEREILFTVEEI